MHKNKISYQDEEPGKPQFEELESSKKSPENPFENSEDDQEINQHEKIQVSVKNREEKSGKEDSTKSNSENREEANLKEKKKKRQELEAEEEEPVARKELEEKKKSVSP
jgi:hypothetical protein